MNITNIQLDDFSRFELKNIKKFKAKFTSPIQLIVGPNSVGKSSFLNELSPFATSKNLFNKKGYKKLELVHSGDTYTLISDYSSKIKVHSFIKNGKDLNLSGTSGIQNELCREHLNYTPLVDGILRFQYQLSHMSKADRKVFFLSINPVDLSIILEKHKYICSKIREAKSNITLLNKRKQELVSKKLEQDVIAMHLRAKEDLSLEIDVLSKDIIQFTHIRDSIQRDLISIQRPEPISKSQLKQFRDDVYRFMSVYTRVKDTSKTINRLDTKINVLESKISGLVNTVQSHLEEINTYNDHLENANSLESTNLLEKELIHKQNEKVILEDKIPTNLIVINEVEYSTFVSQLLPEIYEIITEISQSNIRIREKESNTELKHKCEQVQIRLLNIDNELKCCEEELKVVNNELSKIPKSSVATLSVCNQCDYKKMHVDIENIYLQDQSKCIKNIELLTKERSELIETYKVDSVILDEQKFIYKLIIKLHSLLQYTVFTTSQESLITYLRDDANVFRKKISDSVEYSPSYHRCVLLGKEIVSIQTQLNTLKETKLPSIDFIKSILSSKQEHVTQIQKDITTLVDTKNINLEEKKLHEEFIKYTEKLNIYSTYICNEYYYTYLSKSVEFCNNTIEELQSKKDDLLNKLSILVNILKEQESIDIRIRDELDTIIFDVETNKTKYELIEFGISPNSGFPHKHLVNHINTLINNANIIINRVWSFPLSIQKLDENKELDYSISVVINDTCIKDDISKLSKGQQLIINLAFMVSCILSMGLTEYPIFLDECDDGLDPHHKQKFLELQKYLTDNKYVKQLFMINHEAVVFDGFANSEICALSTDNIISSSRVNEHVTF